MRLRSNFVVACCALAMPKWASATEIFTFDNANHRLVRVETTTMQATYVGTTNISITDFAYRDNTIYALTWNGSSSEGLVTLDPTTGAVTSQLDLRDESGNSIPMAEGLAFKDGSLFMSYSYQFGWSDRLGVLDPATGKLLTSAPLPSMNSQLGRADIDGMASHPVFGLYGENGEQAYTELFDLVALSRVGIDFNGPVSDLWFVGDTMYAIGGPNSQTMRTYDPLTGALLTSNQILGLDSNAMLDGLAVPEPASLLAVAIGLAALVARRRR